MGLKLVRRESPYADDQRIFFLHLPKCGGVSLNRALSRAFGPHNLAALDPTAGRRAAELLGEPYEEYRSSLLWYYMSMQGVNVVTGHFSWSDEVYNRFCEEWTYVTLLRDPVSRWLSHYFYNRYGGGEHCAIEQDLLNFLGSRRAREMGRLYTRRLSDSKAATPDQKIDQAKSTLDKFDIVGILEDMDEFVSYLSEKTGVNMSMPRKNKSPKRGEKINAQSKKELKTKVEKICESDIEVYEHAETLASKKF